MKYYYYTYNYDENFTKMGIASTVGEEFPFATIMKMLLRDLRKPVITFWKEISEKEVDKYFDLLAGVK